MTETRELHVTTMPESKNLKNEFGSFIFRLVEAETEQRRDRNGRAIAGGINYFPEPVHAVLFMSPDALSMLSGRICSNGCVIEICPGIDLAEWTQEDFNPIYDVEFFFS
jgi:hypothetical protein